MIATPPCPRSKPFFFYFCSHHTHAPQFSPDSFLGYSRRGLAGDSLGLIDRSAGRLLNLTRELDIDSNTMLIFSVWLPSSSFAPRRRERERERERERLQAAAAT